MTDTDDRAVSSVLRLYTREVFSDAPGGAENPTPDELAVPLVVRPEDASSAAVVKAMCATVMERFGRIVRKRFQEKGIEAERVRLQVGILAFLHHMASVNGGASPRLRGPEQDARLHSRRVCAEVARKLSPETAQQFEEVINVIDGPTPTTFFSATSIELNGDVEIHKPTCCINVPVSVTVREDAAGADGTDSESKQDSRYGAGSHSNASPSAMHSATDNATRTGTSRQDRGGQVSPTTANGSDGWASSASTGAGGKSASDRQYAAQQAALAAEKQLNYVRHNQWTLPDLTPFIPADQSELQTHMGAAQQEAKRRRLSESGLDFPLDGSTARDASALPGSGSSQLPLSTQADPFSFQAGGKSGHSSALSAPGQFAGHGVNDFFGASTALPQPWSDQRGSRAADTPSSIRSVDSVSSFSKEQMLPASVGSLSDKGLPDHESGGRDLLTMDSGAVDGPSLRRHEQSQVDVMHDEYIRQLLVRANTNADALSEEEIQVLQAKMAYQAAIERNLKSRAASQVAEARPRSEFMRMLQFQQMRNSIVNENAAGKPEGSAGKSGRKRKKSGAGAGEMRSREDVIQELHALKNFQRD